MKNETNEERLDRIIAEAEDYYYESGAYYEMEFESCNCAMFILDKADREFYENN